MCSAQSVILLSNLKIRNCQKPFFPFTTYTGGLMIHPTQTCQKLKCLYYMEQANENDVPQPVQTHIHYSETNLDIEIDKASCVGLLRCCTDISYCHF